MASREPRTKFDGALAGTLLPKLVHLSKVATAPASTLNHLGPQPPQATGASDVEARAAKLELNKQ
ncbi:hypothetical protein JCM3766R1_001344, partial [Sporobolomyces carnicolor]